MRARRVALVLERSELSDGTGVLFEPAHARNPLGDVQPCVRDRWRWFRPWHSTLRLNRGVPNGIDLRPHPARREHMQPAMSRNARTLAERTQ